MICGEVVKRINPEGSHHKGTIFFFLLVFLFLLYLYEMMLAEPMVVITSQKCKSNHHVVCLRLMQQCMAIVY